MPFQLDQLDRSLPAWDLYVFRRHVPQDLHNMHAFLFCRPWLNLYFLNLIDTAIKGRCMRNCIVCDKVIASDQEFGGSVILEGDADAFLSPVCDTCARIPLDVLVTKSSEAFSKAFFDGTLKPDPEK